MLINLLKVTELKEGTKRIQSHHSDYKNHISKFISRYYVLSQCSMVIYHFKKGNFIWPQNPIPMFKELTIHFGGRNPASHYCD